MAGSAVAFVHRYGANGLLGDGWTMVVPISGQQSLGRWLWAQHNEHRFVLPKLIYYGLLRLSGWDVRVGMYASVGALGALALVLMRRARVLRGHTSYADTFFPLALLHLGHWDSFLMGFQVVFVCPTVLMGMSLCLVLRETRFTWASALGAGVCVLCLPLCGAIGLTLLAPLALWLAATAAWRWRVARAERPAIAVAGMSVGLAVAVGALYFYGYARPGQHPAAAGAVPVLETSLQCLTLGFGPTVAANGRLGHAAMYGLAALLVPAIGFLAAVCRRPPQRSAAVGLLVALAGSLALALGADWGRSGLGRGAGFAHR